MKYIGTFLMMAFLISINSCGKMSEAAVAEDYDCGYRLIAGHDCIVCEKGGVSCRWD